MTLLVVSNKVVRLSPALGNLIKLPERISHLAKNHLQIQSCQHWEKRLAAHYGHINTVMLIQIIRVSTKILTNQEIKIDTREGR